MTQALEELAGRLEEELAALKLGVLGGEDAPGYAASLTVEQVIQSVTAFQRDQRDCIEALSADKARLEEALLHIETVDSGGPFDGTITNIFHPGEQVCTYAEFARAALALNGGGGD